VNRRQVPSAALFTGAGKNGNRRCTAGVRGQRADSEQEEGGMLPFECMSMVRAQRAGLSPELGWVAMAEQSTPSSLQERRGESRELVPRLVHLKASGGEELKDGSQHPGTCGAAVEQQSGSGTGRDIAQRDKGARRLTVGRPICNIVPYELFKYFSNRIDLNQIEGCLRLLKIFQIKY
jgi:hypothetical protein